MEPQTEIVVYGTPLCPDCVELTDRLDAQGVSYTYANIATSLAALKEFLAYRDTHPVFRSVVRDGRIGIPLLVINRDELILDSPDLDLDRLR